MSAPRDDTMPARRLKVMLSSTVHAWEDQVEQIAGVLDGYGYEVLNSHIGTIAPTAGSGNFEACLAAVEECDYFLGIIRGYYGSGKLAASGLADHEISITHMEQRRAIQLDKPRSFLVEEKVVNGRLLLRPLLGRLRPDPRDARGVLAWDLPLAAGERSPLSHNPFSTIYVCSRCTRKHFSARGISLRGTTIGAKPSTACPMSSGS